MRSHTYLFSARACIQTVAAPIVGLAILAGGLHAARWFGLLPPPKPIDNPDETLLVYKSQLSRSYHPAKVVLLGDSTCVTGIEAPELRALLPGNPLVLNLGLYIGFGLDIYGELLADYLRHNPDQVELVVVLVSPLFLNNESIVPTADEPWLRLHRNEREAEALERCGVSWFFGVGLLKDRLLRQVLHTPIPGGSFYGFSSDLARYLARHEGSMIDTGTFHPPIHPILDRYYLAPAIEKVSREFRPCLPAGVKLAIAITPIPESLSSREYPLIRDELLLGWNQWIEADYVLTNSPAKLPDSLFASRTHLNWAGQKQFTRQLGGLLRRTWNDSAIEKH